MSTFGRRSGFALAAAVALAEILASSALAASDDAYCAAGASRAPVRVPRELEARVARAFGITPEMARDAAFVRCAGDKLMACWVGANLNCGKANMRRPLPGATAFCRANPGSDNIPMAATGHDTIYAWRCIGRGAVAGKAIVSIDAEGYARDNWRELP
ncbi:MAG: hypothetical protein JO312_20070 [Hyphomicrobiales bacterium]|nr:hypothetical protein [Hyphomicrobiales bacterium]